MSRSPFYTPMQYKRMPKTKLIETFIPLIKKLGVSFGDGRYAEDVEQDCILALLRCQKTYDPKIGSRFPAWANIYLRWAAKCSKMSHCSAIDISYNRFVTGGRRGRVNPQHTVNINTAVYDDPRLRDGVDIVAPKSDNCSEVRYTDDNFEVVWKTIEKQVKAAYPGTEVKEIMDTLRKLRKGQTKALPHKIKVKVLKALKGTILSDPGVVAGLLHSMPPEPNPVYKSC